jgi:hypothetical protein
MREWHESSCCLGFCNGVTRSVLLVAFKGLNSSLPASAESDEESFSFCRDVFWEEAAAAARLEEHRSCT